MSASPKKITIFILVLLACLVLLSTNASAALEQPYFTYTGTFSYDWDTKTLTTSVTTISSIYYSDGTAAPNYWVDPFLVDDPLIGGTFTLGTLMNSADNTLVFGPSPVSFSLDSGGTNYLTANLNNFTLIQDEYGTPQLNPGYDMDNVLNISTNTEVTNSKFLDEVNSFSSPAGNLFMDFNITSGSQDFSADSSGTFSGEFSVVPEPVSTILFVTGGATLALRRYRKKKKYTDLSI
jgi:hypothetical protein